MIRKFPSIRVQSFWLDDSEFGMQFQAWDIKSYKYEVWKFFNFMYKGFDVWLQI
jgi:hypothetical protein